MYDAADLQELMRLIIDRGMRIDTEEVFLFKLHESYPDAPRSPIKFNLATAAIRPEGQLSEDDIRFMGRLLWEYAKHNQLLVPAMAGVPNVGQALARALQYHLRTDTGQYVPMVTMRKFPSARELAPVEPSPDYPPPGVVLAMDDVLTLAHSAIEATDHLRRAQYAVQDFLVVLDYDLGGREVLAAKGVEAHNLLSVASILEYGLDKQLIARHHADAVYRYLNAMRSYLKRQTLRVAAPA